MSVKDKVLEAFYLSEREGLNAREIADKLGVNYSTVKFYLNEERKRQGKVRENHGRNTAKIALGIAPTPPQTPPFEKKRVSAKPISAETYLAGGVRVYEDEQQQINGQPITPEIIMQAKGLKPDEWDVVSFTKNVWQQQTAEGETIDLCQSKLTVRPKKQKEITFADIDDFLKNKDFTESVKLPSEKLKYDAGGETLEVDICDLHCGLLSWKAETGGNYDLRICRDRFLQAMCDIADRAKSRKVKQIIVAGLGDILHVDNGEGTTTKGTLQDTDGRFPKIFDFAFDTMNGAINELRQLDVPIKYIYTCGNHDRNNGYALVRLLELANKDIEFDTTPNPKKAVHFGNVLIGLTHGDFPIKNQGTWLHTDYREEYGNSRFVEIHSGHIHTEAVKIVNGIPCRWLLAQCGNSYWEHSMGYRSDRGLQCFVWNDEKGLRESWYYYF